MEIYITIIGLGSTAVIDFYYMMFWNIRVVNSQRGGSQYFINGGTDPKEGKHVYNLTTYLI